MSDARAAAVEFLASRLAKFRPWQTPDGRSPQRDFIQAAATHEHRVFRAGNRSGKLHPVSEPVLTPNGWRKIGDIRVGDEVACEDGTFTRVTGVFPQGVKPAFRVTFDDGGWSRCGADHLWKVKDREARFRRALPNGTRLHEQRDHARLGEWSVMSLAEIVRRWGFRPKPIQRVAVPRCAPVEFPRRELLVDPYLLGALLGDGSFRGNNTTFTSADQFIVDEVRRLLPPSSSMNLINDGRGIGYRITVGGEHGLRARVASLGLMELLSHQKFVPDEYLYSCVDDRIALLQGLMDTDGSCSRGGHVEFSTTSPQLRDAVAYLVRSLGGKCSVRSRVTSYTYRGERRTGRESYRLSARIPGINPFRLPRKAERYSTDCRWTYDRILVSVEPDGEEESVCISVASPLQTYLTRDCIVTHNTTVGVVDALLTANCWHPYSKWRKPTKGWIVTLDWENGVGGIIWPAMKPWIDPARVKIDWLKKTGVEIPKALFFPNGSEIHFRSAEASARKMQGASKVAWVWFDEEIDQPVFEEVETRLNDLGGTINVTLTPVSRKLWIRDLERREYKGRPITKVVRASMRDAAAAGLLDADRVEQQLSSLPERIRRIRELGDFGSVEGLVWPEFNRETHGLTPDPAQRALLDCYGRIAYPWPLPRTWPRFAAIDFGYSHPTAVPLICLDPNTDRMIVERLYYGKGLTANRWGTYLQGELPPLEMPMVADHDAFQRAELLDCGIETTTAVKDVVPGIEAVDRAMFQRAGEYPRLMFILHDERKLPAPMCPLTNTRSDAHLLAWEIEGYRYPERKDKDPTDRKDSPVKKDDHACDALRYLVMALERRRGFEAPRVPERVVDRHPVADVVPPSPWANPVHARP